MKTNEMTREQISALADGELSDQQINIALAALRQPGARADWEVYHQIGDVLRSEDMAVTMSSGFAARLASRLDAEPTIVAPVVGVGTGNLAEDRRDDAVKHTVKRWAVPSAVAAAAMATVAFFTTPQLMVALKGEPSSIETVRVAAGTPVGESGAVVMAAGDGDVVLRDPRIDDYLLAHQRFSPSVYSTAQYARSATFSGDSGK